MTTMASLSFSYVRVMSTAVAITADEEQTYHVRDDARQKQVLLMLVWAFLFHGQQKFDVSYERGAHAIANTVQNQSYY